MANSRENILARIRKALVEKKPMPFPNQDNSLQLYAQHEPDVEVAFAETFTQLGGKFAYCLNFDELAAYFSELVKARGWKKIYCPHPKLVKFLHLSGHSAMVTTDLNNCDVALTACDYLVARTGSMVLSSALSGGRTTSVYAPIHICIASKSQIVWDIDNSITELTKKYKQNLPSLITWATGPSRTADIEKTLVVGVHGPKEVYCFLLND